jgi:hypothetical protein
MQTEISCLRTKSSGGNGNETSGSIKGRTFLHQLREYQLLKKESPPWSYFIRDNLTLLFFLHSWDKRKFLIKISFYLMLVPSQTGVTSFPSVPQYTEV